IDWDGVHRGADRRRVALPTYPWQRQRHWIDAPTAPRPAPAPAAHALLGAPVAVAGSDALRYEAVVGLATSSWLADHRVFGTVVLPGVAMLEVVLAAGRAGRPEGVVVVEDFVIHRA